MQQQSIICDLADIIAADIDAPVPANTDT